MFGDLLKKHRRIQQISQNALSEKTGIPQTTISDFENNKYVPNIRHIVKIAKALGVPVTELLDDESFQKEVI